MAWGRVAVRSGCLGPAATTMAAAAAAASAGDATTGAGTGKIKPCARCWPSTSGMAALGRLCRNTQWGLRQPLGWFSQ
uniref:Putative secreted protein n=1 Tax=Ixodes ricinus TaxID=34613 RepID=A0A6B0U6A0_IXORI